jgi:hypothetical protein
VLLRPAGQTGGDSLRRFERPVVGARDQRDHQYAVAELERAHLPDRVSTIRIRPPTALPARRDARRPETPGVGRDLAHQVQDVAARPAIDRALTRQGGHEAVLLLQRPIGLPVGREHAAANRRDRRAPIAGGPQDLGDRVRRRPLVAEAREQRAGSFVVGLGQRAPDELGLLARELRRTA